MSEAFATIAIARKAALAATFARRNAAEAAPTIAIAIFREAARSAAFAPVAFWRTARTCCSASGRGDHFSGAASGFPFAGIFVLWRAEFFEFFAFALRFMASVDFHCPFAGAFGFLINALKGQFRLLKNGFKLALSQHPEFTGLQSAECHVTHGLADDFVSQESLLFKEALKISRAVADHDDFDFRAAAVIARKAHRMRLDQLTFDAATFFQLLDQLGFGVAFDAHPVDARNVVALLNFFGQIAVVGQKKQAFAQEVQATHGEKASVHFRQVVAQVRAALRISKHRDHASGLIESHVDMRFFVPELQELSVGFDGVLGKVGAIAQLGYFAVDGDTPFADHLLGLAARSDPRLS